MTGGPVAREGEDLFLSVRLQPRASRTEVTGLHGAQVRIRVTAPPVDGRANEDLLRLLAGEFDVPRSSVELVGGAQSRDKRVRVRAPRRVPHWLCAPAAD
ncbi:MAG: DUF167 domain-containing protein [Gammaproteobacteria bacterium]